MHASTLGAEDLANQYLRGERELVEVLGLDPQYIEQLRGRAQYYMDGEHYERALMMLEMLEELDRSDSAVRFAVVHVLLRLGRSDEVAERLARWTAEDPHHAETLVSRAYLLVCTGAWAEAAHILGRQLEADPQAATVAGQRAHWVVAYAKSLL